MHACTQDEQRYEGYRRNFIRSYAGLQKKDNRKKFAEYAVQTLDVLNEHSRIPYVDEVDLEEPDVRLHWFVLVCDAF